MAELARRSGVPPATIKHYLREGLLPRPTLKTGRNMAYYEAALVPRIRAIKQLQEERYLPLRVIRSVLDDAEPVVGAEAEAALERALREMAPPGERTRAELVAAGMPAAELDFLRQLGFVSPAGSGDDEHYGGDDLALLRTLGAARRAGITADMLPPDILGAYVEAIRALARTELQLFRQGIVPRAGADLPRLVETAAKLSEELVVLLRRKLLLPTLRQLAEEKAPAVSGPPAEAPGRAGAARRRMGTPGGKPRTAARTGTAARRVK